VEIEMTCSELYKVKDGTVQGSILGLILFNLYKRQLLVVLSPICFADDGYYYTSSMTKEAIMRLENKLKQATEWLMNSGMKVIIAKTEFTVFHKSLYTAGRVRVELEWIGAKQDMNVLGIVFDIYLEWTKQVDKSILRAR